MLTILTSIDQEVPSTRTRRVVAVRVPKSGSNESEPHDEMMTHKNDQRKALPTSLPVSSWIQVHLAWLLRFYVCPKTWRPPVTLPDQNTISRSGVATDMPDKTTDGRAYDRASRLLWQRWIVGASHNVSIKKSHKSRQWPNLHHRRYKHGQLIIRLWLYCMRCRAHQGTIYGHEPSL